MQQVRGRFAPYILVLTHTLHHQICRGMVGWGGGGGEREIFACHFYLLKLELKGVDT